MKKLFFTVFVYMAFPLTAFPETQICEIKYGEKNLTKQGGEETVGRLMNNKRKERCDQIGNEFNKDGIELKDKPIYACCKID